MTDAWDELERLAKAATPGPYSIRPEVELRQSRLIGANINPDGSPRNGVTRNGGIWVAETKGPDCEANAAFYAAANPSVVLALIAAARANSVVMEPPLSGGMKTQPTGEGEA